MPVPGDKNQTKWSVADRLFFSPQIPPLKWWQTMAHQRFVCITLPFQGGQFKCHIQCILTHTESTTCALLSSSQISFACGGMLSLAVKSVSRLTYCHTPDVMFKVNFIWFPLNWNIFQGKYLLFEQYSEFTTSCLRSCGDFLPICGF